MEKLIDDYELELCELDCVPGAPLYSAKAHIPGDVSEVMPYLNSVLNRAFYGGDNDFIVWKNGERKFVLRPHELAVSLIVDRPQAQEVISGTVAWINGIWEKRDEVAPDHEKRIPPQPLDVLKHLPGTNCASCGPATCMAFAFELIEGNRRLEDCPYLLEEENSVALKKLEALGL